jgi:pyruvate/2-oxoglutarate/acetoin dehydrogenase E1 component
VAWAAAEALAARGVQTEVVDLRTISPLDRKTVAASLERTGRGLSLEESPLAGGVGAELAAVAMSDAFDYLEAPFRRLGPKGEIIPCNKGLEAACFPTVAEVVLAAEELAAY